MVDFQYHVPDKQLLLYFRSRLPEIHEFDLSMDICLIYADQLFSLSFSQQQKLLDYE